MATRHWIHESPWPRLALFCAGLALFWWAVAATEQREPRETPRAELIHQDRVYRVPASRLAWLDEFSRMHFAESEQHAREHMEAGLAGGLDDLFGRLEDRVPGFLDWYYSLGGEYTRMGLALLSWSGLMEEEAAQRQATERLMPEDFETELEWLRGRLDRGLGEQARAAREGWLARMAELLDARRIPEPLEYSDRVVQLDHLAAELSGYESPEFISRMSTSSLVAGGVMAAPLAVRLARRQATTASGRALAARGASRGAARAGTGAAGGAALCAPGGPAALGCALVAGGVAWLATDWALLSLDEAMNRDEMERELHRALEALREELEADMLAAWDRTIERQYASMRKEVTTTFRPLDAGSP